MNRIALLATSIGFALVQSAVAGQVLARGAADAGLGGASAEGGAPPSCGGGPIIGGRDIQPTPAMEECLARRNDGSDSSGMEDVELGAQGVPGTLVPFENPEVENGFLPPAPRPEER